MTLIYIYIFSFGLIIGSFLNALIWRLHSGESMMDRSMCPNCHAVIRWFDNIPVLSFLFLQGKCRQCRLKISWQYPAVELASGVLFLLAFKNFQFSIFNFQFWNIFYLFRMWFIIAVMIIVFVYDLRWYLILDKVTIPTSIILFIMWLIENWKIGNLSKIENWSLFIASLAIGYGFFALQYYGSKGKWLGGGDVKLGLVMALALPIPSKIMAAIFIAYLLGAVVGLGLIAMGKKELSSKLPFGTFLALATVAVVLYGEQIIIWYRHLTGI